MTSCFACSDAHTCRENDCIIIFPILLFRHYKNGKITYPRNVACSSKQLFFPYQTVFFKNDNWRVYGVFSACYKVHEKAMVSNRYNRIPHPVPKHKTEHAESQEVSTKGSYPGIKM